MNVHFEDHSGRRRPWRRLAPVAAAAFLLLAAAGTGAASNPPAQGPPLPEQLDLTPGSEIPLGVEIGPFDLGLANGAAAGPAPGEESTVLNIPGLTGKLTFTIKQPDPFNPGTTPMKITGFSATSEGTAAPTDSAEQDQGLGEITLEQGDFETTPDSLVKMLSQSPPQWEQTMFLDFTMTIERPPEQLIALAGRTEEPLVLSTKEPGKLIGQLDNFPPKGEIYQLENPIKLVIPDDPENTIAQIDKFPVKVSGL
ncbi:hypothetical protein K3N28_15745 [Glycomyces sp. TRM65418]|uniref:hypothetical protein n=1 Tax=Glycomyces sp. TRM65418 TaxID=2867006 RepID=UPI001CE6B23A|nr:hypothetical protein [Glycomyces sp. TRM65418]MCC3764516.1 hypothetical protein [Glycomyces sp. TRM65418]QZD54185.1 hypothetical protein K3N28_15665 [Glycomyces sp. TRM65418]